jgi:hypothetical protein
MKRDALQLVRILYRANKSAAKAGHLDRFLDAFEWLKLEIGLCTDMKVLSFKDQTELSVLVDSIGRQVTGWRNKTRVRSCFVPLIEREVSFSNARKVPKALVGLTAATRVTGGKGWR